MRTEKTVKVRNTFNIDSTRIKFMEDHTDGTSPPLSTGKLMRKPPKKVVGL